jgi:formylglycine-generating enzyme required for sulfatase activity
VADPPVSDAQAEIVNAVGMKFKLMPPGEFQMGDPDGRPTEVPHKVTLTRPFFMGVHEVTNAQWQSVMKAWPREASKRLGRDFQRDNNPVVLVDWAAAKNFCDRLSSLEDEQQAGRRYRLPTSAEWEYACRAGTGTKYSFGDEAKHIGDHAWFFGNADQKTQAVGQKTPNPWGLFDMYGNVWEWCSDWRGPYRADAQTDPTGPASSELQQRVLRGGCFTTKPDSRQPTDPAFHSAARLGLFPAKFSDGIGFRVVFDSIEAASREAAAKPLEPAVPRSTVVTPAVGNPAPPPDPTAGAGEEGEEKATPIELALRWIADHQLPDGGWSFDLTTCAPCAGKCSHSGESKGPDRCGATAMALLPFLGRGYTHREGPYRKQIDKGLGFLVGMVTEGQGKAYGIGGSLYSQGLAAIVLSECLAMSGDDRLRAPAQAAIDFIVHAQDPAGGGWRYSPRQPGDTSSFGWQVTALHSGHLGGLKVSPLAVRKAITFLDSVQADDGAGYGYTSPGERPGTSAVGLLCRTYLGWNQNHPALRRGVAKLAAIGPTSDLYFDYYATRLMHYVEGDDWVAWNKRMKAMLVASQSTTGHEAGSWHDGVDGGHGASTAGRLYCTSLAAMILEIPYRWLPIYQRPVKAAAVQAR